MSSKEVRIKAALKAAGFARVGITTVEPLPEAAAHFKTWLDSGCTGDMNYLKKNLSCRQDPGRLFPLARSVVAAAAAYRPDTENSGPIAAYARYPDYHLLLKEALGKGVDIILDGGVTKGAPGSTVLDVTATPPRILREGMIGSEQLKEFLIPF